MERNKGALPFILISKVVFIAFMLLQYFFDSFLYTVSDISIVDYIADILQNIAPIIVVGIISAMFISKEFTLIIYTAVVLKTMSYYLLDIYIVDVIVYLVILAIIISAIIIGKSKFKGKWENIVVLVLCTLYIVAFLYVTTTGCKIS